MPTDRQLRVAVFPGAANLPLYLAQQRGLLREAGLEVTVTEVASSQEQLGYWETGGCDIMHTSPDHTIRRPLAVRPLIVRRDPFGELSVHRRPGDRPASSLSWAVDGLSSGFAFVLRALLEDCCHVPADQQQLVAIGGTRERFEALDNGDDAIDGTTLHPPFDELARLRGHERLAGHLDVLPELFTLATVVRYDRAADPAIAAYLEVLDGAVAELRAGGGSLVEEVLTPKTGPAAASAARAGMFGPGGLDQDRRPTIDGVEAVIALRQRFDPSWSPPVSAASVLGAS